MKAKAKKILKNIAQRLPSSKLLLIFSAGIILAVIAYLCILLSR